VLPIEIIDFFSDVVRLVLESPHALLQRFALSSNARELVLLLSQLHFRIVLRGQGRAAYQ
jgi:hypothetical protein